MRSRVFLLAVAALAVAGAVRACVAAPPSTSKVPRELLQARLEAARRAYDLTETLLHTGKADFSELPLWSRRWLEAERALATTGADQVAALEAHLERMKALEKGVRKMMDVGFALPRDGAAATYYRVEAEVWLREVQGR